MYRQTFESRTGMDIESMRSLHSKIDSYLINEGFINWGEELHTLHYHSNEAAVNVIYRSLGNHSIGILAAAENEAFLEEIAKALPELTPKGDRTKIQQQIPSIMNPA